MFGGIADAYLLFGVEGGGWLVTDAADDDIDVETKKAKKESDEPNLSSSSFDLSKNL